MYDELVMDKDTGEPLPATEAIHIFYSVENHKYNEPWTDKYIPTGQNASTLISPPNFAAAIKI